MGLARLVDLFAILNLWCCVSDKPVVLLIDEVDSAANNQVFLDFLAQLRYGFLKRLNNARARTFHSVILAGVTDIKHLKSKMRDDELHKVNSPWIAREGNEPSESLHSFGDCPRDEMTKSFDIAVDFNYDICRR